jgi:hypothetical protein
MWRPDVVNNTQAIRCFILLKLNIYTHNEHNAVNNVLLIAYGHNSSRIITLNRRNAVDVIPSGLIYLVQKQETVRSMSILKHSEAIIKVQDNIVSLFTGFTCPADKTEKIKIQAKLDDKIWKDFIIARHNMQVPAEWIESNPTSLINFD